MFLKTLIVLVITLVPVLGLADTPVPNDHSTVHIMFVVPYEAPDASGMGGGMFKGNGQTKPVPRAVVGDTVLPIDSIHPISISIDGEFVGHSMSGTNSVKPVFVLPSGQHKFEFSCDIFKTTKADLKVVGTGSKQYLIVKLVPETKNTNGAQTTGNTTNTITPP